MFLSLSMAITAVSGFVLGRSPPIGRVQPVVFFFTLLVSIWIFICNELFFSGVPVN